MLSLIMSAEPTVFVTYALSSGDATKAPAMKAAATILTFLDLPYLRISWRLYETSYGIGTDLARLAFVFTTQRLS
jgi:hypothetical protein